MCSVFRNTNPNRHFRDVISSGFNDTNRQVMILKASLADFNTKSEVDVKNGELAIFVQEGKIVQILEPSVTPVKTKNYPFITNFLSVLKGGKRSHVCALYFVRTTIPKVEVFWGTSQDFKIVDPQYVEIIRKMDGDMIFITCQVGGGGTYKFKIDPTRLQYFFEEFIGDAEAYTYETLSVQIKPALTEMFQKTFENMVKEYQAVDIITPTMVAEVMLPKVEEYFTEKLGLKLIEFKVDRIAVTDSKEKKAIRARIALSQTKRTEIMTEALRIRVMHEAEAQGKIAELKIMGEDWLKIRLTELAEKALSNSAISQIGTTALGGYLGTHSEVFSELIRALIDSLNGGRRTADYDRKPEEPSPKSYAPVNNEKETVLSAKTAETRTEDREKEGRKAPSLKEETIRKYTKMYANGQITEEAYIEIISDLSSTGE